MAVDSLPPGRADERHGGTLLLTSAIVAALGSFLFGFDTAVISGTTQTLQQLYGLSDSLLGFSRRPVLAALGVLYFVSAVGCAWAWDWYSLLLFRWIGGIAVGGASVVSPVYITEIAPARRRGLLVAVSQLNIVIGILAAYFSNYVVAYAMGAEHPAAWRWMFGIEAAPALLFLAASVAIPESPRWLVKTGRRTQAEEVLARFGHEAPRGEAEEIERSLLAERSGVPQRLFQRRYLRPLLLAAMIGAFNQLDGINAIIYYTADIFRMAGADKTSALMQSVIVGLTNLVMTIVAMILIDRAGRKMLLLAGSVTFVISHALAAWVFYTHAQGWIVIAAMMGIVGSHAYSQGAVVWVIINELLPNAIRASGSAAICFLIWLLCIGVSWTFPVVARHSGGSAFAFFAGMMVLQFFLVLICLPETKGASLEELQTQLAAG
ncbi:MAG: sugar porter family MFS transporter [Planctomycetes bacterium]|nr:sugar porter family MFS transporter [Planctomycetota bacterium]